ERHSPESIVLAAFRIDLCHLAEVGKSHTVLAFSRVVIAANYVSGNPSRVYRDRPARLGNSLIVITCVHEESATCHVSVGEFRVDLDCLAFVGEGFVGVALSPICSSAMTVSDRAIVWAKLVRLNEVRAGGNGRIVGVLRLARLPVLIDLSQRCTGRRYN